MNESEWTPGKTRKMRKADQHRFNPETGCLEVYQIDVPAELEDWEKEGLEKQAERRALRAKRETKKQPAASSQPEKKIEGGESDERNSDLSD